MAKDSSQVISAGNAQCTVWLSPVGTAFPATMAAAFASPWVDAGYLKVPPSLARAKDTTDLEVWNADEPLASILNSDVSTVTLALTQINRLTLGLYFGKLTYSAITGGIHAVPAGGDDEFAFCLELIDGIVGGKVIRTGWRRTQASEAGNFNMDKADAVNLEVTLKRLVPASGTSFFIDTNMDGVVTP